MIDDASLAKLCRSLLTERLRASRGKNDDVTVIVEIIELRHYGQDRDSHTIDKVRTGPAARLLEYRPVDIQKESNRPHNHFPKLLGYFPRAHHLHPTCGFLCHGSA